MLKEIHYFFKLLNNDQAPFRNFSRMSVEDFNFLLDKVCTKKRKNTNYREATTPKIILG